MVNLSINAPIGSKSQAVRRPLSGWPPDSGHLTNSDAIIEFALLRGPEQEDHVLYSSHTMWRSREDFEAWTRSEAFRLAHQSAGQNRPLYLGHPQFEGFDVIQTVRPSRGEG